MCKCCVTYLLNGEILLFIRTWPSQQKRALSDWTCYSAARRLSSSAAAGGDDAIATTLRPWLLHASIGSQRLSLIINFFGDLADRSHPCMLLLMHVSLHDPSGRPDPDPPFVTQFPWRRSSDLIQDPRDWFTSPDRKCEDLRQVWQLPHQSIVWSVTAPASIYCLKCDSSRINLLFVVWQHYDIYLQCHVLIRHERFRFDLHHLLNSTNQKPHQQGDFQRFSDIHSSQDETSVFDLVTPRVQVQSLRFESYCDNKHWSTHHRRCFPDASLIPSMCDREPCSSSSETFRFSINVLMQRFLNKRKSPRFPCD